MNSSDNVRRRWFPLTVELAMVLPVLAAAFLIAPWASALSEAEVERDPTGDIEIAANVHFDGSVFTITNHNYFDWTNIEVRINSGFPKTHRVTIPWIRPGASYAVDAREFVTRYGGRFNPLRTKLLQFSIWCDTNHGTGFWHEPWQ